MGPPGEKTAPKAGFTPEDGRGPINCMPMTLRCARFRFCITLGSHRSRSPVRLLLSQLFDLVIEHSSAVERPNFPALFTEPDLAGENSLSYLFGQLF